MNWIMFAILSWVFVGLEVGFRSALQVGHLAIAPSFVLIFVVFIALWAKPANLLLSALVLGVSLDLVNQAPTASGESATIVGPWALGCMLASYTVLNFRALMFRRNPLTMAFLCAVGAGIANVLVLAILAIRAFYDDIVIVSATSELWQRGASSVYTGLLALIIAPVLHWMGPWLGFKRQKQLGGHFR